MSLRRDWQRTRQTTAGAPAHLPCTTPAAHTPIPTHLPQGILSDELAQGLAEDEADNPSPPSSSPMPPHSTPTTTATAHPPRLAQGILSEELAQRLAEDEADNRRRARTLALHYTGGSALGGGRGRQAGPSGVQAAGPAKGERSVRCTLPQHGREGPSGAAIAASAMAAFK